MKRYDKNEIIANEWIASGYFGMVAKQALQTTLERRSRAFFCTRT
jgi:hypothetical protein